MLAGNALPAGAEPIALAYAGHQFGSFVPQLGDGRAILLGEVVAKDGRRVDIQLKGSGRTPFSRGGDGRAALGPVLREYVVSEAMAALGVPTTRALAAVLTGEPVRREEVLPGAVLTRVAASHIRVGTFEFFAARDDREALTTLASYALRTALPRRRGHRQRRAGAPRARRARPGEPRRAVARGRLRARRDEHRQHGDLGRDDRLRAVRLPRRVRSEQDLQLDRPRRALRLREPAPDRPVEPRALRRDTPAAAGRRRGRGRPSGDRAPRALLRRSSRERMRVSCARSSGSCAKRRTTPRSPPTCSPGWRRAASTTRSSSAGSALPREDPAEDAQIASLFAEPGAFHDWSRAWRRRLAREDVSPDARAAAMRLANPAFIPRNHRVAQAIDAAVRRDDFEPFETLVRVLARPYEDQPELAHLAEPPRPEERVLQTFCGT